jgi:hypothetical protein
MISGYNFGLENGTKNAIFEFRHSEMFDKLDF